jgi:RNA polymerase sigma-70 factor (ECF subfamily)
MAELALAPIWMAVSPGWHEETVPADEAAFVRELLHTGGEDLYRALVQRYGDRVFRVAAAVLGPGRVQEAEEVAQEAFLLVFRKLASFRGECTFSTWLVRLARNLAIDRRRRAAMQRPHVSDLELGGLPAPAADPEEAAAAAERRARVRQCLERLSEPQRSVIYLYYWQGASVPDIAELLDLNRETVKSHLHRARQRLAAELGTEYAHG